MGIRTAISNFVRELRGNPLDNPGVPLSMSGLLSTMAGEPTASGEQINTHTAMQQNTVYACMRVIADSIASLPIKVYEASNGGKTEVLDHPLVPLLQVEPNDEMSSFTLVESLVGALVLTGNAYAEIQRDAANRIVALWPLHPERTKAKRTSDGKLVYETTVGMADGRVRYILPTNIIHVPLFSFDGVSGLSPIALARQGIGLARAAEKFGARYFGNGARPGGVLSTASDLDDDAKQALRETWSRTQGGENQGRTAFLFGDWKYQPIGITPEDSQFLETRQFQRSEITAIMRVPAHMVGDTSKISNSSYQQLALSFVSDTLRPYLSRIEAEFNRKLIPTLGRNANRHWIEFDVSERLRVDMSTTMQTIALGRQWSLLTANEGRHLLGYNRSAEPQDDVRIVPVNMAAAAQLLKEPQEINIDEQPDPEQPPNDDDKAPEQDDDDDKNQNK